MEFHTAHSLSRTHGLDVMPRRKRPLRSHLRALIERMRAAAQRSADRERLMAMSCHELADIGLTRCDVVANFSNKKWPFRRGKGGQADA